MLILLEWVLIFCAVGGFFTALYLILKHFHRKWKWQDQVNENELRRAILEEADVQFEVDEKGFIRPVKRKRREPEQ